MASDGKVPSELQVAEKWDRAVELGVKRMGYGALLGVVCAALLFRSPSMRAGTVGMAMGVGLGMTYADTKHEFAELQDRVAAVSAPKE